MFSTSALCQANLPLGLVCVEAAPHWDLGMVRNVVGQWFIKIRLPLQKSVFDQVKIRSVFAQNLKLPDKRILAVFVVGTLQVLIGVLAEAKQAEMLVHPFFHTKRLPHVCLVGHRVDDLVDPSVVLCVWHHQLLWTDNTGERHKKKGATATQQPLV